MASKKTKNSKMTHIKNPSGFDVGLIGLAVMGQNLSRNIADKDFKISVFNRTTEKTLEFVGKYGNTKAGKIFGTKTIKEFTQSLKTPRKIIIMVKAGEAVDEVIKELIPYLNKGDILMDGGNSYYKDTQKRQESLAKKGIHLLGMGISGGEEGALKGPSIMPGGDFKAYNQVKKILKKIAATEILPPAKFPFRKCVTYIGNGSSGHFVKMVHNGIEYAIMQAIAETYDILKKIGKFSNKKLSETFSAWNKTENLNSFLIEITAKIFLKKDEKSSRNLIDLIQDQSQQKGTGKWTAIAGFDYGRPVPGISSAVEARSLSAHPARGKIPFPEALNKEIKIPSQNEIKLLAQSALELTTILSYLQGFEILKTAESEEKWGLNLTEIARIWKNGCIIRSSLLEKFQQKAYFLKQLAGNKQKHWRKLISLAISQGIPVPTTQATLSYYDSLRAKTLPQNLTQAMRDFFGAHGYARIGQEGTFHTDWQ